MSGNPITEIGLCGKIPGRGDFLARGLAVDFIDSWNEWLQAVLAVSREQLQDNWLETYLTSPVWHFALSAGVCGDHAMAGTVIPSVDQVGRHYPFTLAGILQNTPVQAWLQQDWTGQLEQQILTTLDDDFELEPWLEQLKATPLDWPNAAILQLRQQSGQHNKPSLHIQADSDLKPYMLLHQSYRQQYGRYCLWWTEGSEHVAPCLLISSGLPQVSQYAAMLDGNWQRWHWQSTDIITSG